MSGLLAVLNLDRERLGDVFRPLAQILSRSGSEIITTTDLPQAAVLSAGAVVARVPRAALLAALVLGWVKLVRVAGQVRRYAFLPPVYHGSALGADAAPRPRDGAEEEDRRRRPVAPLPPILTLHRRRPDLIGPAELRAAYRFHDLWVMRDGPLCADFEALRVSMPPKLMAVLEVVIGEGAGLEDLEARMRIPARSGKALISVALDAFIHLTSAKLAA